MGQVRNSILQNLLDDRNQPVPGRTIHVTVTKKHRVSVITRPDGTQFTVIADTPSPGKKGNCELIDSFSIIDI